jgi:hypothetical protein
MNTSGSKPMMMPERVLDAAASKGGDRTPVPDEKLYILKVQFGDEAYNAVNNWVSTLEGDARVHVNFTPPLNIWEKSKCPPKASMFDLLREASSIAFHYAPLTANDFREAPVIAGPLAMPVGYLYVRRAQIALHALHGRIQNPEDPKYPVISGLPTGTYICTVTTTWANVIYAVAIFKH